MSIHMSVSPALEGCTWVISVLAVKLDQLIENAGSSTKMLITKVISEYEKDLSKH
jgi:hypothetical protein